MASVASLAKHPGAPKLSLVHSAPAERPLFVPPGIAKVRTGPTTAAELARLTADEPVVVAPQSPATGFRRLLALLGLASAR